MYIIITAVIVGGLFGAFWSAEDGIFVAMMGFFFGGMISGLLAVLIGLFIGALFGPEPVTHKERVTLRSIQDNDTLHGSFFLGSGSVDDVPTYSYYKQVAENSFAREDVDASLATIHYTDARPYFIHNYKRHDGCGFCNWYINTNAGYIVDEHYDFYIPKGSIVNEYRLDAK
jgi:hypothetical protein